VRFLEPDVSSFFVRARPREYGVFVGRELAVGCALDSLVSVASPQPVVVTQKRLVSLQQPRMEALLGRSLDDTRLVIVGQGERAKSVRSVDRLWRQFAKERVTRDTVIVAIGGGVVSDLAGFAAATYMRGLAWVNVATSLMAQVDAGVGGKTAVNIPEGRNLVGAFHSPCRVIVDLGFLPTLSRRHLTAGVAEIIKCALALDGALLERLIGCDVDGLITENVVEACLRAKARIVEADEFETGQRRVLNLGHTLAHALEAVRPGRWLHGEAVGIGLRFVLRLARHLGLASPYFVVEAESLLDRFGLGVQGLRDLSFAEIEPFLGVDKKCRGSSLRWQIPIAAAVVEEREDVTRRQLVEVFEDLQMAT